MSKFYLAVAFYINNKLYDRLTFVPMWHQRFISNLPQDFEEHMRFIDDRFCFDAFQQDFDFFLTLVTNETEEDEERYENEYEKFRELLLYCFPNLNFTGGGDDVIDEIIDNVIKPMYNKCLSNPGIVIDEGY